MEKWRMLVHFLVISNILQSFDILYGHVVIWYIFPRFGILCQEKSGSPDLESSLFPADIS
jgi:hypothetical protein